MEAVKNRLYDAQRVERQRRERREVGDRQERLGATTDAATTTHGTLPRVGTRDVASKIAPHDFDGLQMT